MKPRTALALGAAAWTVPAVQWAAYLWCGRPHPLDPGARRSTTLLDRAAVFVRIPDHPIDARRYPR